ncbi:hypothetical protein CHUAL_010824 [Chamberlinius hualienensis]
MDTSTKMEEGLTTKYTVPTTTNFEEKHQKLRKKLLFCGIGLAFPVMVPMIHIGIFSYLWSQYNRVVDRTLCSCSCWDTVFKGNYESGISAYKHVYFNATFNTFKIWFSTVLAVIVFYESVRYAARLVWERRANYSMLILFASVIYPHYYSWWAYFNYLNDEFYAQWYHQTYFTLTELASTIAVLWLADKRRTGTVLPLLVIVDVATAHILISGFDQLVSNVLLGDGKLHQVLRDVGMFLPDLLHVAVALIELRNVGRLRRIPALYLVSNRQFLASLAFIGLSWTLCLYM